MRAASNNYVVKVIVGTNVYDYNAAVNCAGNLEIFSLKIFPSYFHFLTVIFQLALLLLLLLLLLLFIMHKMQHKKNIHHTNTAYK